MVTQHYSRNNNRGTAVSSSSKEEPCCLLEEKAPLSVELFRDDCSEEGETLFTAFDGGGVLVVEVFRIVQERRSCGR